jgi:hypothetical protein
MYTARFLKLTNPRHYMDTLDTRSHLEDEDTVTSANTVISHSTIVNPSTVFHARSWPLSTNSGHCLENDAGSDLEDEDTATSSTNMVSNFNYYHSLYNCIIWPYWRGIFIVKN